MTFRNLFGLVTILLATLAVPRALAQTYTIRVTLTNSSFVDINYASGANASLNLATNTARLNITVSASTVDIGRITLTGGPTSGNLDIIFGSSTTVNAADSIRNIVGDDWDGLNASGMTNPTVVRLSDGIGGDLTGSVTVGMLWRFDALGQIQAPITSSLAGSGSPTVFVVQSGSFNSGGDVLLTSGDINRVRATAGSIAGSITASNGKILLIDATGNLTGDVSADDSIDEVNIAGDIGASGTNIDIFSGYIIGLIEAANIYADISTSGANGQTQSIRTTSGDFVGSLTTDHMDWDNSPPSGIDIAGDLLANVTFTRYAAARYFYVDGEIGAGKTVSIGEGWYNSISEPRDTNIGSLAGQIILNALNNSFIWERNVTVNSYTLGAGQSQPNQAPYYERVSDDLGGGAIGLAPFHLHDEDCLPPNGTTQTFQWTTTVAIRHYGPVQWASGQPVTVYYRETGDEEWLTLDQEYWTTTAGADPRDILVTATTEEDFQPIYDYKIVPSANLKCAGVSGNPAVDSWVYYLYGQ